MRSQGIEWPTLFFFLGLFVMVGALEQTGVIDEVADGIASLTDGDRTAELLGIAWVSAIGSAFVDNIPFTAAMIPVVEQLAGRGGDDAYWWALALGACFGGNVTIIAAAANVAAAGMAARAGQPIGFVVPQGRRARHARLDAARDRVHRAPLPVRRPVRRPGRDGPQLAPRAWPRARPACAPATARRSALRVPRPSPRARRGRPRRG